MEKSKYHNSMAKKTKGFEWSEMHFPMPEKLVGTHTVFPFSLKLFDGNELKITNDPKIDRIVVYFKKQEPSLFEIFQTKEIPTICFDSSKKLTKKTAVKIVEGLNKGWKIKDLKGSKVILGKIK